jgi:hypothetical protein
MAKPLTTTIPPEAEADFIEQLLPWVERLARDASGPHLAAVAHYQSEFKHRQAELKRLCGPRRRRKH